MSKILPSNSLGPKPDEVASKA